MADRENGAGEKATQCPDCGGQMSRGCLTGFRRIHWTPFPEIFKKFGIRLAKAERVLGWSCNDCGRIVLRVEKKKPR